MGYSAPANHSAANVTNALDIRSPWMLRALKTKPQEQNEEEIELANKTLEVNVRNLIELLLSLTEASAVGKASR